MSTSKSYLVAAITLFSILTLVIIGIPFGDFSDVAFANLYGSSSATDEGASASAFVNASGVCIISISTTAIPLTPNVAIGTGDGNYTVVKNTVASEDPNYKVIQINNSDNTQEFEVWLNLLTGACAVRAA